MIKRKIKSIAALILVIIFAMVMSAGNAFAEPSSGSTPDEIVWYYMGSGQQADSGLVMAKLNNYIKDKLNATVDMRCLTWGDDFERKTALMAAAGEPFDIVFAANWSNYQLKSRAGNFMALDGLLPQYAPKTKALLGNTILEAAKVEGVLYGLPIPGNGNNVSTSGVVIRKDLLKKYKLKTGSIKTLSDLEPLLKVIKAKEKSLTALASYNTNYDGIFNYDSLGAAESIGVLYNDSKDMKVFNQLEKPEMKSFFTTMNKFYKAGYLPSDMYQNANPFYSGKAFAVLRSNIMPYDEKQGGFEWEKVALGKTIISTETVTGSMQALSYTSTHPEKAMQLLELVNTDPYVNNLINFGIEKIHYTKAAGNIITKKSNSRYDPDTTWMFGNEYLNYIIKGSDAQKALKTAAAYKKAVGNKTLGFTFDNSAIRDISALCNSVYSKYMPSLYSGEYNPSKYLPLAIKEFKAAGVDQLIAEKQKQLDTWLQGGN